MVQAIEQRLPAAGSKLASILKTLKQQPDIVTLMTEDEIAMVVNGLEHQTGVVLATAAVSKAKTKTTAKLSAKLDEL